MLGAPSTLGVYDGTGTGIDSVGSFTVSPELRGGRIRYLGDGSGNYRVRSVRPPAAYELALADDQYLYLCSDVLNVKLGHRRVSQPPPAIWVEAVLTRRGSGYNARYWMRPAFSQRRLQLPHREQRRMKTSLTTPAALVDSSIPQAAGVAKENTGVIRRCVMSESPGGEPAIHTFCGIRGDSSFLSFFQKRELTRLVVRLLAGRACA